MTDKRAKFIIIPSQLPKPWLNYAKAALETNEGCFLSVIGNSNSLHTSRERKKVLTKAEHVENWIEIETENAGGNEEEMV